MRIASTNFQLKSVAVSAGSRGGSTIRRSARSTRGQEVESGRSGGLPRPEPESVCRGRRSRVRVGARAPVAMRDSAHSGRTAARAFALVPIRYPAMQTHQPTAQTKKGLQMQAFSDSRQLGPTRASRNSPGNHGGLGTEWVPELVYPVVGGFEGPHDYESRTGAVEPGAALRREHTKGLVRVLRPSVGWLRRTVLAATVSFPVKRYPPPRSEP